MSSIWEIPDNIQFPPDYKVPPNFNYIPLFDVLFHLRAREMDASMESGALSLGIQAFFFLMPSQPHPGGDYVALRDTPIQIQVLTWTSRRQALLDYLGPYLADVRKNGSLEQTQFVRDLLEKKLRENVEPSPEVAEGVHEDEGKSSEDEQEVETYLQPAEAIEVLERIAVGHASTSIEYTGLQVTIRALRFLIESGEAPEFMRYVDQMSKWVPSESA